MSKNNRNHTYQPYERDDAVQNEDIVSYNVAPIVEDEPEEVVVEEVVEDVVGIVENCTKLNVRVAPNSDADVECVILFDTEVIVNEKESTEDFYKVCLPSGVEGYCMKRFIEIQK